LVVFFDVHNENASLFDRLLIVSAENQNNGRLIYKQRIDN